MIKLFDLFKKHKEAILYLVFGGLTTLVNIVTYSLLYYLAHLSNSASNIIAWVTSVVFAYITNKLFVFENKSRSPRQLFREVGAFFACRLLTGALDLGIMFLFVDVWHLHALVMKILSNILVIILNYVASKYLIFKKERDHESV